MFEVDNESGAYLPLDAWSHEQGASVAGDVGSQASDGVIDLTCANIRPNGLADFMRSQDSQEDQIPDISAPNEPEVTVDIRPITVAPYHRDDDDKFESDVHREAYALLSYNYIPLRLQGKGKWKQRKAWKQNIKRRYALRYSSRTGSEELFHVRGGGDSKQRKQEKSITSLVQAKWHKYREVPRYNDSLQIVQAAHNANHQGHNILQARISQTFFIPGIAAKCIAVSGRNCQTCATHEAVKKKPTQSILTSRRGELVIFDLTKFYCPVPTRHNRCACHI